MLKHQSGQSSDLLSSRLAKNKTSESSQAVNVSMLRHKEEAESSAVPTYGPNQAEQDNPSSSKKREKKRRGKKEARPPVQPAPQEPETAEEFDLLIDDEDYKALKRHQKLNVVKVRISKIALGFIILLCLYLAFLIYGLIQTNYIYNEKGEVIPEILSVEDLRTLGQYNTLSDYYLRVRILYEDVLEIDYELSQNADNGALLAMEYTALLDNVSKLSTDLEASKLDTGYTTILSQMFTLVNTHIAVYLQNMSTALTTNNSNAASEAMAGRKVVESEFTTLTSNMAMLCNATNGANNGDIYAWSPTGYMESLAEEAAVS